MVSICHITTVHPAFDDRIFHRECKTLANAGYSVYLIASHYKDEVVTGVHILHLPRKNSRLYRFLVKDWIALLKALYVNAQVYHFHDPELIFVGLLLKLFGKKVIYDVHEDVGKQILNKNWLGSLFIRKFISGIFDFVEQIVSSKFDAIVAATESITKRFDPNKTILLRNFSILELIDKAEPAYRDTDKFIIIYAGGLTRIRGIKEIIQAIGLLNGSVELWLFGRWESERFEEECKLINGWENVRYFGFRKLEEVYSFMKACNAGIVTLYPQKNYLYSLPVKAFEYMACKLPIVMSNFSYWKDFFKDCALFVDPSDPRDIADKISFLVENSVVVWKLGNNGRRLVQTKYSWEAESKKLVLLYRELIK